MMEKKIDRAELSKRAWRDHREKLMAGAKKAGETRKRKHPKKKKVWECSDPKCGMRILSFEKPKRKWGDGHICRFKLTKG
jgi:hypothetical protein